MQGPGDEQSRGDQRAAQVGPCRELGLRRVDTGLDQHAQPTGDQRGPVGRLATARDPDAVSGRGGEQTFGLQVAGRQAYAVQARHRAPHIDSDPADAQQAARKVRAGRHGLPDPFRDLVDARARPGRRQQRAHQPPGGLEQRPDVRDVPGSGGRPLHVRDDLLPARSVSR
jgi:hypothetical protein